MRRRLVLWVLLLFGSILAVFGRQASDGITVLAGAQEPSSIDPSAARVLSDAVVDCFIMDDCEGLYRLMEKPVRGLVSVEALRTLVDHMYAYGGRPLAAEYKSEETGRISYNGGGQKPVRRLWYALRTAEHEKGYYYLYVGVVPDEDRLACAGFSVVTFAGTVPDALQCFARVGEKISRADFSCDKFGYGSGREEIEAIIGEPIGKSLNNLEYNNNISILYRDDKAVFIFVGSPAVRTSRGISVGDSMEEILRVYGEPDKNDPRYVEYDLKNDFDKKMELMLGFSLEDGKISNISIADYQAGWYMY